MQPIPKADEMGWYKTRGEFHCQRTNGRVRNAFETGHLVFPRWPVRVVVSAHFASSIHRTRRDGCGLSGGPCGFPSRLTGNDYPFVPSALCPAAPTALRLIQGAVALIPCA
jgi:hypothetical protein